MGGAVKRGENGQCRLQGQLKGERRYRNDKFSRDYKRAEGERRPCKPIRQRRRSKVWRRTCGIARYLVVER